jgi:hypothetical protein
MSKKKFQNSLDHQRSNGVTRTHLSSTRNRKKLRERSAENEKNVAKKILHHKLGTCGYKTDIPNWDEVEVTMRAEGQSSYRCFF